MRRCGRPRPHALRGPYFPWSRSQLAAAAPPSALADQKGEADEASDGVQNDADDAADHLSSSDGLDSTYEAEDWNYVEVDDVAVAREAGQDRDADRQKAEDDGPQRLAGELRHDARAGLQG